ncbi:unnamed protein product [Urochloa humidicola]
MAPRALQMLTCFNIAVNVPLPAEDGEAQGSAKTKRRWSGEIKRKILASARRERVRAVKEDEEPCDANVVGKQQATTVLRSALKLDIRSGPRGVGALDAVAAAGIRERKGLRVRFDLPAEKTVVAPVEPQPPPLFPTGVLGEPPESFACSGPEMTAAFLASVIAADGDSATPIDNELVARWTERKEACSRRARYLRDYCPFRREEDEDDEDEESAPEKTMMTLPAGHDHVEEAQQAPPRVKTGLAFDSTESEAEFVKAIRSRYLLKDDFISRHAAKDAGGRWRRPSSFVQELKAS